MHCMSGVESVRLLLLVQRLRPTEQKLHCSRRLKFRIQNAARRCEVHKYRCKQSVDRVRAEVIARYKRDFLANIDNKGLLYCQDSTEKIKLRTNFGCSTHNVEPSLYFSMPSGPITAM